MWVLRMETALVLFFMLAAHQHFRDPTDE